MKCTLVQALRLCTDRTARRGSRGVKLEMCHPRCVCVKTGLRTLSSRGIALLFPDHGTRRGWGVSITPRPLFTSGKDPHFTGGWVGARAENLVPTGIRSPDRPARSQSPYRLRYPAHKCVENISKFYAIYSRSILLHFIVNHTYIIGCDQLFWLWIRNHIESLFTLKGTSVCQLANRD